MADDLRTFIRDVTRRNELVWAEVMAGLRENTAALRDLTAEIRDLRDETREMRDETRAQRDGLFKLIDRIDRLGEGPGPAPA